jgi:hypothetical protein
MSVRQDIEDSRAVGGNIVIGRPCEFGPERRCGNAEVPRPAIATASPAGPTADCRTLRPTLSCYAHHTALVGKIDPPIRCRSPALIAGGQPAKQKMGASIQAAFDDTFATSATPSCDAAGNMSNDGAYRSVTNEE